MKLAKYLMLFVVVFVTLFTTGCTSKEKVAPIKETDKSNADKVISTNASNEYSTIQKNNFDFSLLTSIQSKKSDENICISPISFKMALLLACNGADGETKKEILQSLNLKDEPIENINTNFQNTLNNLNYSNEGVTLNVINAIWANESIKDDNIFNEYSSTIKKFNLSDINFLKFNEKDKSAQIINKWVSDNTKRKISGIISPDEIKDDLVTIITNAVYFNGKWNEAFEKENTKEKDFNIDNQTVKCQMMSKYFETNYFENDKYQSIKIPYKNSTSMYVFLPSKEMGILDFIKDLHMSDIDKKIAEMSMREGSLELPKFKSEFKIDIPFSGKNSFNKIASIKNGKIAIDKIVQKTFIDLNEEGTEAAAITAITMQTTAAMPFDPPKPFSMIVDRPFFYFIMDDTNKEIIFMGIVNNPNK